MSNNEGLRGAAAEAGRKSTAPKRRAETCPWASCCIWRVSGRALPRRGHAVVMPARFANRSLAKARAIAPLRHAAGRRRHGAQRSIDRNQPLNAMQHASPFILSRCGIITLDALGNIHTVSYVVRPNDGTKGSNCRHAPVQSEGAWIERGSAMGQFRAMCSPYPPRRSHFRYSAPPAKCSGK
ncbi:hypothetical protein SJA_C2-01320 [Sphingobium indicum UT26S]|uniref:Uncharacterized protein n=1 Tax=Sphingobium indicum (strain DSM 16413 / CCM 7287 / MTCC 6362 / UT26 / NBRC 101211 / UT26S) TaxID=452662 RepID=D4Z7M6_SPHIU|nr:hypothetical protein SJA_C2-01320 [Sphingobium indicum UT26S]